MSANRRLSVSVAILALLVSSATARAGRAETDVLAAEWPEVRVAAGGRAALPVTLTISPEYHTMANPAADSLVPTSLAPGPTDFTLTVVYPRGDDYTLIPGMPPIKVYGGTVRLRATLTAPASAAVGPTTVPLVLRYQACSESNCLAPVDVSVRLAVEVLPGGSVVESAAPPPDSEAADLGDAEQAAREQLDEAMARGLPWVLLLVFLGGLALNLTPCVFPLLPVTAGFFASQGEHRVARTLPMALLYVLSLAAVFTLLGMASAFAGSQIGAFLQSIYGRATIAVVLLVLAASLFGAFEIRVPGAFLARFQGKTGWVGAILMGLAVGLVAAPCVAPFVSALVLFVARGGNVGLGALLFFVLAVGLGTPYLFLGVFTGLVNKVPRGGGYLVWVRRVLAFPLLALVVYFLRADLVAVGEWLPGALYAAVALAGAVYLGIIEGWSRQPWSRQFIVARVAVAMVSAGAAVGLVTTEVMPALGVGPAPLGEPLQWRAFRDGDLQAAADQGDPAVLYLTSRTCTYCWAMDRHVFRGRDVVRAAEGVRLLKLKLDGPLSDEARELKEMYARAGPPGLVFLDGGGRVVAQRGKVDRAEFLDLLARIRVKH